METVGIRKLRNRLSFYLEKVKQGELILVMEREKMIASIIPFGRETTEVALVGLIEKGAASWKGGKPGGSQNPPRLDGRKLSDIVAEDRR